MAKLIISLDGVTVREVVLDRDHISLGRRSYNHIVLDNLAVSGDHAVFQYIDGAFYVEDLHSTNGTSVNGVKIKQQKLWHNDETASRYGENSRRRFEEMFTADHMIDAYVNLYTTLLESKS